MGENGAGKSTFIKVLTGVFPREAGETRLEGRIIAPINPKYKYIPLLATAAVLILVFGTGSLLYPNFGTPCVIV
jgi:ABC-type polysaccharide/polyol phosphate transport system ATPase subunit